MPSIECDSERVLPVHYKLRFVISSVLPLYDLYYSIDRYLSLDHDSRMRPVHYINFSLGLKSNCHL